MEIILLAALVMGLAGFIALGVEDARYWKKVEASPARMSVPIQVKFWEDGLPSRRPLPWAEPATA